MARIKYSGLIENIRGSIAGTTFQNNAYGYTVKKKPNIIRPTTSFQQRQKLYFAQAVNAWNQLTSAQRADWESWASTYPQYAKNNPSSQLSGYAVFVRTHVYRFMNGDAVDTNPTYISYATPTYSYTLTNIASVLTLNLTTDLENEEFNFLISLTRPFSGSQNFVGTKPRFMLGAPEISDAFVITTEYTAQFGALPAVGQIVGIATRPYGFDNGQVLAQQVDLVQVAAA